LGVGTGGDLWSGVRQERIGGTQQLLHPCPTQTVGDEAPRAFGLDKAAVTQTREVFGDSGLPHARDQDHLANRTWAIPQREQTGQARGIGEAAKEENMLPGGHTDGKRCLAVGERASKGVHNDITEAHAIPRAAARR
jgi:hypothetical protein